MVKTITASSFDADVKNESLPVVIDFFAEWCGPCREMAPAFEELATEMSGQWVCGKINIDDERELAIDHGITSIPTLIVYRNGERVISLSGAMSKDEIKVKVTEALQS